MRIGAQNKLKPWRFCYPCNSELVVWAHEDLAQATVEAAIMIPVIFILLLLLLQPGILLYDRCVMNEAATEACRVLATCPSGNQEQLVKPYVLRRLGSIPQQDNFHIHGGDCSYHLSLSGDENSQMVSVELTNEVKPLPLIGFLSSVLGILNDSGNFEIKVESKQNTKPIWTSSSPAGSDVEKWIGSWI